MKVIDLRRTSKLKKNQNIVDHCGGLTLETRWLMRFENGISGLSFEDPINTEEDRRYFVSMAFYKAGLGIYCRNLYSNYLILLHTDEIRSIEIYKKRDEIKPSNYSLYKLLRYFGVSEFTSAKYLMPKEIIEEHKAQCIIHTEDKFIRLTLDRLPFDKLIAVFKMTIFADKIQMDVKLETSNQVS